MTVCSLQASPVLRALRLTASCRQNGAWWSMKIRRLSCRLPGPLGGGGRGGGPAQAVACLPHLPGRSLLPGVTHPGRPPAGGAGH